MQAGLIDRASDNARMLIAPNIDPIAIALGPIKIHWYGLMYLVGFAALWWFGLRQTRKPGSTWTPDQVSDLVFYGALGVILGGRLGYVLFYNLSFYAQHPLDAFKIWQGGMSLHGGLIGTFIALLLFARRHGKRVLEVTDFASPWAPIGLGAGRLGNFINHELWGRPSDVPWAMVFPNAGPQPRHPSQLYEFFLEGVVLFLLLWWFARRPRPAGAVTALFLIGYGAFRFFVEFFREPDAHIGFLFAGATMGQLLSAPMVAIGIALMVYVYRRDAKPGHQPKGG